MNEIIKVPTDVKRISDFMNDLPNNCMFNKVTTGSGMTSLALLNDVKYVIAMPYVTLIQNKEKWCKENNVKVLSIYSGGSNASEITLFEGNKIMVTYDSLPKVVSYLSEHKDIQDWKLCVDESHTLLFSASFRYNAVKGVLDNYNKFGSYVFGTATPVNERYQLPALRDIRRVTLEWSNTREVAVDLIPCKVLSICVSEELEKHLNGSIKENAHVFINSVNTITDIVSTLKTLGYNDTNNYSVVCASNKRNDDSLETIGLPISRANENVTKINFYTSTAFEGCDIYDADSINYLISDGSLDHSKIDITTTLPQIIGRVRDSKNMDKVKMMYTKNTYITDLTEDEFEAEMKLEIESERETIDAYNKGSDHLKRNLIVGASANRFLVYDEVNDTMYSNENALYAEMNAFETTKRTYHISYDGKNDGLSSGVVEHNSMTKVFTKEDERTPKASTKAKSGKVANFSRLCQEYIALVESKEMGVIYEDHKYTYSMIDSVITEAYEELGADKMKALKYRKSSIQKEMTRISRTLASSVKIVRHLNYRIGQFVSSADAKKKMQKGYDLFGINKKAKGSDLRKLYELRCISKRVKGKVVKGFMVVFCKVNKDSK